MGYEKKSWINRQSEYPNRRRLTAVNGQADTYEVAREEGLVIEDGDIFGQTTMNDLETRVASAFGQVADGTIQAGSAAKADAVAWTGITDKPTSYPPQEHSHTATYTATLGTGWSADAPYTQSVAVAGLLASDNPIVDVVLTGTAETDTAILEGWGMVSRIVTADGALTVTCYDEKPEVEIPIQIKVVR